VCSDARFFYPSHIVTDILELHPNKPWVSMLSAKAEGEWTEWLYQSGTGVDVLRDVLARKHSEDPKFPLPVVKTGALIVKWTIRAAEALRRERSRKAIAPNND